jgi:hypothetical protein
METLITATTVPFWADAQVEPITNPLPNRAQSSIQ